MRRRVVSVPLTEAGVERALRELNAYKTWLERGAANLLNALAEEGVQVTSARFQSAEYDGTNDVSVSLERRGKTRTAVVAAGAAVLFIEFGTGVRYPDSHPEASANGFSHGGYGHRLGRLPQGWRYDGDPGTHGQIIREGRHAGQVHTYGNPASMAMYGTVRELKQTFAELARRCFP